MTRKRHTEEQIIAVLKDAQAGIRVRAENRGRESFYDVRNAQGAPAMNERRRLEWWRVETLAQNRLHSGT